MALASKRTQEFDRLLVRDLQLRDPRNQPYPAGKVLLSDGRGGTYFGDAAGDAGGGSGGGAGAAAAFNEVAIVGADGTTTERVAAVVDASRNVLRLGSDPNSGIGWHAEAAPGGGPPTLYAYTTDIKAIRLPDSGDTVYGNALADGLLYFQPAGDTQIDLVGGSTLRFTTRASATTSTLSGSLDAVSTLTQAVAAASDTALSTLSTVNTFLTTTGIAALVDAFNAVVRHPGAAPELVVSSAVTSSLTLGGATLGDAHFTVSDPAPRRTAVSTLSDVELLTVRDAATGTVPALYRERSRQSVLDDRLGYMQVATHQAHGFGWLPALSSNASLTQPGFVPLFEQTERMKALVSLGGDGGSVTLEYSTVNRAFLDEVVAGRFGVSVGAGAADGVRVARASGGGGGSGSGWTLGDAATGATVLSLASGGALTVSTVATATLAAATLSTSLLSLSTLRGDAVHIVAPTVTVGDASGGATFTRAAGGWALGTTAGPSPTTIVAVDAAGAAAVTAATAAVSTLRAGTAALSTITADALQLRVSSATLGLPGAGATFVREDASGGWRLQDASSGAVFLRFGAAGAAAGGALTLSTITADTVEGVLFSVSDERLKTNVAPVRGAVSTLAALRPVTYEWRAGDTMRPGVPELGFIAQNVDAVVPAVVRPRPDAASTLTVCYDRLTALLTAGVQEQQGAIAALQARVAELEGRWDGATAAVDALTARVAGLTAEVDALRRRPAAPLAPAWAADIWGPPPPNPVAPLLPPTLLFA